MHDSRKKLNSPQEKSLIRILAQNEEKARRAMTAADKFVEQAIKEEEMRNSSRRYGMDGYSNAPAGLGASSFLLSSGIFLPSNLTRDITTLTNTYRSSWLAKKIIDMPAEDMTRNWYTPSTSLPMEDVQMLKELEAKHSVKQEITNAIRWARLYGGSLAVIVVDEYCSEDLSQPLDLGLLLPGCFHGLLVLDRTQGITPSIETESDLEDPDYGLPKYYTVDVEMDGALKPVKIHHSRVLRFTGRELPASETIREDYWGASELEHIMDELMKRESASANIAQLIFQANVTTLKSEGAVGTLTMGTTEAKEGLMRAVEIENQMRTSFGLQLLGSGDEVENMPYNFGGISEIYEQFMLDMAGAAEIPATKLFGRSPAGMNATGESDLRNYYETIVSLQERILRPALEKLLPVMALSCWGEVPKDMKIVFEPVMTMSMKDQVEMAEKLMGIMKTGVEAGIMSVEEARNEMKAWSERTGVWSKL